MTDDPLEVEDVYERLQQMPAAPRDIVPANDTDGVLFLEHMLNATQRRLPPGADALYSDTLVWECEKCGARGEDLGAIPVVCE